MPKVFLTGSGVTRGYLTGSGFISNPPRYLIRQFDSATGSYPTIARTGDASRMGNYSVSFDDTSTMIFDDPYAEAEINFDMVFQTKIVPITTPGIYYGPVNSNILGEGYKEVIEPTIKETFLSPLDDDTITLTDTDGNSVVFTFKYGLNLSGLANNEVQIPINRYDRKLLAKNFTKKINEHPGIKIQAILLDEPKKFRLPGRNDAGKSESFANGTIKLRQQKPGTAGNKAITKSLTAPSIFGTIEGISITNFSGGKDISRISYPQVLDSDIQLKIQEQGIATPNFSSENLDNSGGVIRKGISDAHIRFTKGEDLTAFDDSRIDIRGDVFYEVGTPENIYPGFSSKLSDKTQIVIDISSAIKSSIGYNTKGSQPKSQTSLNDTSGARQRLMAYYNPTIKKWETIARGINSNYSDQSQIIYNSIMNEAVIGFGPLASGFQLIGTSSNSSINNAKLLDDNVLASLEKPISNFGFPFSGKYHATSSQTFKMSSYINQPFVVEKVVIDFDAEFEGVGKNTYVGKFGPTFGYNNGAGNESDKGNIDLTKMQKFNFFLLRQFESKKPHTENYSIGFATAFFDLTPADYTHFTSSIPGHFYLGPSGSNETTYVTTGREMITYGSMLHIVTSSAYSSKSDLEDPASGINFDTIFNSKLAGDANYIIDTKFNASLGYNKPYTGSFSIEFPCRHTAQTLPVSSFSSVKVGTNQRANFLNNDFSSRGGSRLEKSSRALVNGQQSLKKGGPSSVSCRSATVVPDVFETSDASSLDKVSPYILFPNDELVLGFQYPLAGNIINYGIPGSDETLFDQITFTGPAKLTLYGSQIKKNVEFHDTLNQPLTSDAVHEVIHYDNPVIDQFDLAQRTEYVDSSLDQFNETGFILRTNNPASRIGKKIESLISGSVVGMNGAFSRYRQAYAFSQIYFDSMLPNVRQLFIDSQNLESVPSVNYTVNYGNTITHIVGLNIEAKTDSVWPDNSGLSKSVDYTLPFNLSDNKGQLAFQSSDSTSMISKHDFPTQLQAHSYWTDNGNKWKTPETYSNDLYGSAFDLVDNYKVPAPTADSGGSATATHVYTTDQITYEETTNNFGVGSMIFPSPKFKSEFIYPYKNNPDRSMHQDKSLTLLLYRLKYVDMYASGTYVGTAGNPKLAITDQATDAQRREAVDTIQAGYETPLGAIRRVGYMSGDDLIPHLFGGTFNSNDTLFDNFRLEGKNSRDTSVLGSAPTVNLTSAAIPALAKVAIEQRTFLGLTGSIYENDRTFSYGIINTNLQRRKSYYRSDRFTGQVADLVHPGFDTAFSQLGARLGRNIRNFKNTSNEPLAAPVVIKFVTGSNVKPQNDTKGRKFKLMKPADLRVVPGRQSSNMSIFATSSMPFFDDDNSRN